MGALYQVMYIFILGDIPKVFYKEPQPALEYIGGMFIALPELPVLS